MKRGDGPRIAAGVVAARTVARNRHMDVVRLTPPLHMLRFAVGSADLWEDPDGLILIDAGVAG